MAKLTKQQKALRDVESQWVQHFGTVVRIGEDSNGNVVQTFHNPDGEIDVAYIDVKTEELNRRPIFLKCTVTDGALAHFTGLAYDGLLDEYVDVPIIKTGDRVLLEGYVKYGVKHTMPDKRIVERNIMYLSSTGSIQRRLPAKPDTAKKKAI